MNITFLQDPLEFVRKSCHIIKKNLPDELLKPHSTLLNNQYYVVNELSLFLMIEIEPLSNYEIYIKKDLQEIDLIVNELYSMYQLKPKEEMYKIINFIINFFENDYLINFISTKDYFIHFYYYYEKGYFLGAIFQFYDQ